MTLNAQLSTTELGCTVMNKIDPRELLYIALLCIGFLKLNLPLTNRVKGGLTKISLTPNREWSGTVWCGAFVQVDRWRRTIPVARVTGTYAEPTNIGWEVL